MFSTLLFWVLTFNFFFVEITGFTDCCRNPWSLHFVCAYGFSNRRYKFDIAKILNSSDFYYVSFSDFIFFEKRWL